MSIGAMQILAVLALPGTATIGVPWIVVSQEETVRPSWTMASPAGVLLSGAGLALVAAGLGLMAWTITIFATRGRGTLAPWDPPRRLVIRGPYRHVRNPMISGVFCVLLGESFLLASTALFGWFLIFVLLNALYIPLVEEPGLVDRFGEEYLEYRRNVPRWIPRLRG